MAPQGAIGLCLLLSLLSTANANGRQSWEGLNPNGPTADCRLEISRNGDGFDRNCLVHNTYKLFPRNRR